MKLHHPLLLSSKLDKKKVKAKRGGTQQLPWNVLLESTVAFYPLPSWSQKGSLKRNTQNMADLFLF